MTLQSGSRLGPYEIIAHIGAGGMGDVWKARDTRLDRIVAIKVSQDRFSERFEREARTVAALNHPHICTLYDVGPNYLVMEYIQGSPIKGPLPLEQALKYATQICDALDAAHKKHIIHRDLKPGNILVTKSGVKLLDFGLAKISSAGPADAAPTSPMTQDGMIMGTLPYMSPEQLEGKEADARSDIYSLGLVLYEMVTGKRAFPHTDIEPLQQPALERVVRLCLFKDPDARWQSAHDIKVGLQWSGESGLTAEITGTTKRNGWRERAAWFLTVGFLATSLVFASLYWSSRSSAAQRAREIVRFTINPPEKTIFAGSVNVTVPVMQFALSPDGRGIVFAAAAAGSVPVLWVRLLDDVIAHPLSGTEGAEIPFWSPDSLSIGFFADGKLKKVSVAGGAAYVIAEKLADPRGGSWGPEDMILFADGAGPIKRVSSGGGPVTPLTHLDTVRQEGTYRWPHILPDGHHFLYTVRSAIAENSGIYAASLDGKIKKRLVGFDSIALYTSPGYVLFLDGDALLAQRFDASRFELSGQAFNVAGQLGHSTTGQGAVSVSAAGTLAYASAAPQRGRLTWFDRDGHQVDTVIPEGEYSDFRLSPDDRHLAASLVDPKTGQPDIWMTDLERGSLSSRFTFGPGVSAAAVWSPEGTRIIFRSNRKGGLIDFYQKSAAGGGNEETVLSWEAGLAAGISSVASLIPSDWSRSGEVLFSAPTIASAYDIWVLPTAGERKPVKFIDAPGDQSHANISSDGRFVAYSSNESGKYEVHVQTFPPSDNKWQISTSGGYEPRWRTDGREIYYLSPDRKLMAVSVGAGPSFGVPKPLFQIRVPTGVNSLRTHYVPTHDGRRFLINNQSGDPAPVPITVVLNWIAGLKK